MAKLKKLSRDDFFAHDRIQKLVSTINRKTQNGFNYIYLRDRKTINLLRTHSDWLDYVGMIIYFKEDKKIWCLKWLTDR